MVLTPAAKEAAEALVALSLVSTEAEAEADWVDLWFILSPSTVERPRRAIRTEVFILIIIK